MIEAAMKKIAAGEAPYDNEEGRQAVANNLKAISLLLDESVKNRAAELHVQRAAAIMERIRAFCTTTAMASSRILEQAVTGRDWVTEVYGVGAHLNLTATMVRVAAGSVTVFEASEGGLSTSARATLDELTHKMRSIEEMTKECLNGPSSN